MNEYTVSVFYSDKKTSVEELMYKTYKDYLNDLFN